jgi:hypothetical protein
MVNRGCMPVILVINILVSRLGFSEVSSMVISSANEKFTFERHLMHFLIIE